MRSTASLGRQRNQRWRLQIRLPPVGHFKIRHWTTCEEMAAGLSHPPGPASGPGYTRAIRGDASIGVHHSVNSGDEYKGQPSPAGLDKFGTLPDGTPTVETVPHALGSGADFFGRHHGMIPIQLGAKRLRDEPAPGQRNSCNGWRVIAQRLFPTIEIDGAGIRAQHYELGEGAFRADGGSGGCREGFRTVAGQAKNERSEHVHAVTPEGTKLFREFLARQVEILVDIFQSFRSNRFHSHQRALDTRGFHGIEKFRVFRRFHCDLSKEDHVIRKLGETRHQLEPFRTYGFEFIQPSRVFLLNSQAQVSQGYGIEIVVRQRDETKAQPPELHDFLDHHVGSTLTRPLAIRAPDRAERTMLGATANRLYRGPHIAVAGNQIPAGGDEIAGFDLSSDVDGLGHALAAIGKRPPPRDVAVTLDHRVRAAEFERFVGIKSGVNSAKDYKCAPAARHLANLVTAQRVRGMNTNPDRISRVNRVGTHLR